jgi:hypothetical protein
MTKWVSFYQLHIHFYNLQKYKSLIKKKLKNLKNIEKD